MKHLITIKEISQLARPCNAKEDLSERCIEEAELLDVKPVIGDKLYLRLMDNIEPGILMDGGRWIDKNGNPHIIAGLKKTTAYYAYARIVRNGTGRQTASGFVEKRGEYSDRSDLKERMSAYEEAFSIADGYMKEVLSYISNNQDIFPETKEIVKMKSNRTVFKIIGS